MTYVRNRIPVERIIDGGDPDTDPVCVGGQSDATGKDRFLERSHDPTPSNLAEINRHLAGAEGPVRR